MSSYCLFFFFFSSRRRHTRFDCDWSSDVCSSDLDAARDLSGDVLLNGEQVRGGAVVLLPPHLDARRRADEIDRDPHPSADALDTPARQVAHPEGAAEGGRILMRAAPVAADGVAGLYGQALELAEAHDRGLG